LHLIRRRTIMGSHKYFATIFAWLMIFAPAAQAASSCDSSCLKRKALLGDGDAAMQLANAEIKTNRANMIYWYRVAAENGSGTGQYNYGTFLVSDSKGQADCIRALFWFKKAAATGNTYAMDYIGPLEAGLSRNGFSKGCSGVID